MIQMRENRYDDIRKGIVNRTGESAEQKSSVNAESPNKKDSKENSDSKPRERGEGNEEEYNSWS